MSRNATHQTAWFDIIIGVSDVGCWISAGVTMISVLGAAAVRPALPVPSVERPLDPAPAQPSASAPGTVGET